MEAPRPSPLLGPFVALVPAGVVPPIPIPVVPTPPPGPDALPASASEIARLHQLLGWVKLMGIHSARAGCDGFPDEEPLFLPALQARNAISLSKRSSRRKVRKGWGQGLASA